MLTRIPSGIYDHILIPIPSGINGLALLCEGMHYVMEALLQSVLEFHGRGLRRMFLLRTLSSSGNLII